MKTITKTITAALMLLLFANVEAQLNADAGLDKTICAGNPTTIGGSPTGTGGAGSYTYIWSPTTGLSSTVVSNPIASPVVTTKYFVLVTDALSNTTLDSVTITVNQNPVIDSFTTTNVSCFGGQNGSTCVQVSGGSGSGYVYSWNTSETSQCISNKQAGFYFLTVTDFASICTASAGTNINQPAQLTLSETHTDVLCNGGFIGTINLTVSGGVPPYNYFLNGLVSTQNITNLTAGSYTVAVTDINGCTTGLTVTIAEPTQLIVTETHVNVLCNGSASGSIDLTAIGGTPNYTFWWSNNVTTEDLTNLVAGSYTVTASDVNGCTAGTTVTITEPAATVATIVKIGDGILPDTLSASISSGCVLSYNWSNLVTTQQNIISSYGNYTITIVDCNGCTATAQTTVSASSITVTYPNGGENLAEGQNVTLTWNSTAVSQVKIEFYSSISFNWITVVSSIANTGAYVLTVPALAGTQGKIRVTDVNNVSIFDESNALFNIVAAGSLTTTFSTVDVTCNGIANGSAVVTPYGGTLPYQFSIDGGITFQGSGSFPNLMAGNYSVIVHDAASAADTVSFNILEPTAIQITLTTADVLCNGGSDGSICANVSGGLPPYSYIWTNVATTACISGLNSGVYSTTVTDGGMCAVTASVSLFNPPLLTAQIVSATGGTLPDTLSVIGSGGTSAYNFAWSNLYAAQAGNVVTVSGVYGVTVTDANGCVASDSVFVGCSPGQCMWPGDADANGLADNNDLLAIGLGYGTNGTSRAQQDINWYGHPSTDWTDTLASGSNYKHIDCDGNGTINANDTLAIIQNYGQVHAKTDDMPAWRSAIPALYIDLVPDTSRAGDTLIGYLSLGDTAIPVSNLYGLAFTVNYDPNVVDSSKTSAAFGNSWLGTATDKISIAKDLKFNGQLKCAITRIDHSTRSGSGQIGQVSFVITTDNINGSHLSYYNMHVWLSDITMIDNNGNHLDINAGQDSSQVEFEPTGISEVQSSKFKVQINPNPASDAVQIIVSEELITGRMIVVDMEGRVAADMVISTSNFKLETANFTNGIYLVKVKTEKGILTKRLVIAR